MKKIGNKNIKQIKSAIRALVLFSGGLDSILAVKVLEKQGIIVSALTFTSYFFDSAQAEKSARENKIKLIVQEISKNHLRIVRNPRYGHGSGMNPCIDCHLLMLKVAKMIAEKNNYSIVATGEVLGQRPMSQNIRALKLIEKKAKLEGRILRPLSAKSLPETEMEKKGLVERNNLFGISGRSRKEQLDLAKKFLIKYFPTPAGGCILTDKEYSRKLCEILEKVKKPKPSDFELLRAGRHFWNGNTTKIILGRNHEENLKLKNIAEKNDVIVEPKNFPGPTALLRGKINENIIKKAKEKILEYCKKGDKKEVEFKEKKI
jgi:tRNA-uridine 2-sulfurtransferase